MISGSLIPPQVVVIGKQNRENPTWVPLLRPLQNASSQRPLRLLERTLRLERPDSGQRRGRRGRDCGRIGPAPAGTAASVGLGDRGDRFGQDVEVVSALEHVGDGSRGKAA